MYSNSLEQANGNIKQQTVLMARCLSQHKLMDAFKHASNMLSELRNPLLSPKQYYELYVTIYDTLTTLQQYLVENHKTKHHLTDLYELVQYAGNIIPRLYLMITVGSAYLYIEDSPKLEICKDMIEMCNGVQQPVRGLFLRYYLSQRTKEFFENGVIFIDNKSEENIDKIFKIDFITTNFIEMNKLWVRLQYQGPLKEKDLRTKERKELQVLIGSNLVRLSSILELSDVDLYTENVLPRILEQVVQCRDIIAQEYLLEIILKIFPEEFQISGLTKILECSLKLTPKTSISKIIITLIERMILFKKRSADYTDSSVFNKIWSYLVTLDEERPDLPIKEFILIISSLTQLVQLWDAPHPYINLDSLYKFIFYKKDDYTITEETNNMLKKLLLISSSTNDFFGENIELDAAKTTDDLYFNLITKCEYYVELLVSLSNEQLKIDTIETIFHTIFDNSNKKTSKYKISNKDHLIQFTKMLQPCLLENCELVSKFFHLIKNKNLQTQFDLLNYCHNWIISTNSNRGYILESLIVEYWKLIRKYCKKINTKSPLQKSKKKNETLTKLHVEKIDSATFIKQFFKTIGRCIQEIPNAEIQFKMNCTTASLADQLKLKDLSYDFFVNAFINFEEMSDSQLQYQSIVYISQCLQKTRSLFAFEKNGENKSLSTAQNESNYYENLITKCTLYGSKLLNKQDQCRSVLQCSHLWWCTEVPALGEEEGVTGSFFRDGKRVLECLQRSLRVADSVMDNCTSFLLTVEILNRVLYYFIHGETSYVTIKYCNGLIELIKTNLQFLERETRMATTSKNEIENSVLNHQADSNSALPSTSSSAEHHANFLTCYGIGIDGTIIKSFNKQESSKLSDVLFGKRLHQNEHDAIDKASAQKSFASIAKNNRIPIEFFERTLNYIKLQRTVDDRFKLIAT